MDMVIMHFVDEQKMETYRNGNVPVEIRTPEKVAAHYHIPTIHLAHEVTDRIDNGEFNWEDDFRNLHPSPFGQGVYASSIRQFLDLAFSDQICEEDVITPYSFPVRLDQFCYENGILTDVSDLDPSGEWYVDPEWEPADSARVRPILHRTPMLVDEGSGTVFTLNFKGNAVGIVVAAGPDAGIIEYRIDNGEWKQQNLFTGASRNLHLGRYFTLASGLEETKHKLEIRLTGEKDVRSRGHACRIRNFYVNQIL
jgi:sialidase-1